ncbi:TPA: LPXTG cell wall anchor domain-containing protein [Streptococcus suis]
MCGIFPQNSLIKQRKKQVSQPAASKPVVQEKAKTLPNTGADLGLVWTLAGIGVLGSLVERRKRLG